MTSHHAHVPEYCLKVCPKPSKEMPPAMELSQGTQRYGRIPPVMPA